MKKAAEAFRSIGEVSQLVGVAPHVLRYWESQFPLFSPVKRRDGRRYYRPDDVKLAAGLCELLREEGVSIRGAKKQMQADRGAALKARGTARLGGAFAAEAPATDGVTPVAAPIMDAAPPPSVVADAERAPNARKRKAAAPGSLPLFPELEPKPAESPGPSRPAATASIDWLGRLATICAALQDRPAIPADTVAALLDRLARTRRGLAR